MIAAIDPGANDAITAILALLVASMLRVIWSLQQRISRLEAIDEYRERIRNKERENDESEADGGKEVP